jgi:Flp pilus assembly protein TadG
VDNKTKQVTGLCGRLRAWCAAGGRDERGAAAVFFAVGLLLLAPATMGLVDIYMITSQRGQLQEALDTATLYAARADTASADEIQEIGEGVLRANLKLPDGQEITSATFTLDAKGIKVTGHASIEPPEIGPRLWEQADVTANSEVLRNSNNIEVVLVLDTTGSMKDYMGSLRSAANELVNLVVKPEEEQKQFYTKVALVPYAVGVNVGASADAVRGGLIGSTAIKSISKSNSKVVIESIDHGLQNGERVLLSSITGARLDNGQINSDYAITWISKDKFSLNGVDGRDLSGTYGSGGKAQCLREGCRQFRFQDATRNQNWRIADATNCVSERTGAQAYSDISPTNSPVGRVYQTSVSNNKCASSEVVPLTIDKTLLTNRINALKDAGSTAGQIGVAWGWYMISPEWGHLWDERSAPAAYGKEQTLKAVVLMTDGAFNSPYCKGIIAKNAGSGSGNAEDHINCNATNGDPFDQAEAVCRNMKSKKIIVYTVAFNVSNDQNVTDLMTNCATSPDFAYRPDTGAELKVAFKAIAQDINALRISK